MIKNRLYILFFTSLIFLCFTISSFAWHDDSKIDSLTIDNFIIKNRDAQSHANSFPEYYSAFDKFNYVYEIERKDKHTGKIDYDLVYSTSTITIKYDSKFGYYNFYGSSGFFYSVNSTSIHNYVASDGSFLSFNALYYDIKLKGVRKANYQDMTLTEGELTPPGENQETPLGVIGDLSFLSWLINLVIKYLIWAGVLIMCYLILPTLLKKLLNYFLDF